MTPRPEQATSAVMNDNARPKFEKDWLLNLVKRHSSTTSQNTPKDLRDCKILAVAPMVDQSDLPFRLLCRRYGANIAFTPMIHCKLFVERDTYREKFFNLVQGTPSADRPLMAQLCGSDTEYVVKTATLLQPFCDGIDLNCGCPQSIARRGNYGAFLLEQPETLVPLVKKLTSILHIPVSVKVRVLPTGNVEDSLQLYQSLVDAGASLLTIHGRTRLQKGPLTGRADWNIVKLAVNRFPNIPILCNGSMSCLQEIQECLEYTRADGVMCSEALLEYPPIYTECTNECRKRIGPGRLQLAQEYLQLARQYPPEKGGQGSGVKCLKAHLHRFLHADLQQYTDIRDGVTNAKSMEELEQMLDKLQEIHTRLNHDIREEQLSWYVRHRTADETTGKTKIEQKTQSEGFVRQHELMDDAADCMTCLFDDGQDGDY